MTQIQSNGEDWLFVPVKPTDYGFRLGTKKDEVGMWYKCKNPLLSDWTCFKELPIDKEGWSIHSTLSESLENEKLAKEITGEAIMGWYSKYVGSNYTEPCEIAIESLTSFLPFYSIDPSKHWLILKKEA